METEKLAEKLETADSLDDFLDEYGEHCIEGFSFIECFQKLNKVKKVRKADIVERSTLPKGYAYELFRGEKRPSRDKVLMISFGLLLDVPETQLLLRHSGYNPLTPKVRRDATVLYALTHHLKIHDLNDMLGENSLDPLL